MGNAKPIRLLEELSMDYTNTPEFKAVDAALRAYLAALNVSDEIADTPAQIVAIRKARDAYYKALTAYNTLCNQ